MDRIVKRIRAEIKVQNALGLKGESWDNQAIANDVLLDDLGYNQADRPHYDFDNQTKNILLANARQDAAHALSNTISLLERIDKLDRTVQILTVFVIAVGIAITFSLWKIIEHSPIFLE